MIKKEWQWMSDLKQTNKITMKKLLKEAFEAGRDYQFSINPYSGKPANNLDYPSFTKWYNKRTNKQSNNK
jgi:hypothetical protein